MAAKQSDSRMRLIFHGGFYSTRKSPPTYLASRGIRGTLLTKNPAPVQTLVKLKLTGTLTNIVTFKIRQSENSQNLSFVCKFYECSIVYDFDFDHEVEYEGQSWKCLDFHIPLDSQFLIPIPQNRNDLHSFPPSTRVESRLPNEGQVYSAINYKLKATMLPKNMAQTHVQREVQILPDVPEAPAPLCALDFDSEYVFREQKHLRNKFGRSTGRLTVSTREPLPIGLRQTKDEVRTILPLTLLFNPPGGTIPTGSKRTRSPPTSATVTWSLHSSTYISIVAMQQVATTTQAQKRPSMRHCENIVSCGEQRVDLSEWKAAPATDRHPAVETCEAILCINNLCKHLMAPTFSLTHLSKRYALSLRIDVANEGSVSFQLKIPIQFMYLQEHQCRIEQVLEEPVGELPQYVP